MKGKLKFLVLFVLIMLAIVGIYVIQIPKIEKLNEESAFRVNKIALYSSANGAPSEELKEYWEVNVCQYTDIAIYVEKLQDKTIDRVYIDNINIENGPQIGTANVYKKSIENFGKFEQVNETFESLEFNVSQDDEADFLDDCSVPITVSYVNNLQEDYIITNNGEQLEYNETILKKAKILTSELEAQISFDVNIIDKDNSKYTCKISLEIPIEELMNGQNMLELDENINFIREDMN